MASDSAALRERDDGLVLRLYTYYRPTILVLLKEHESHGYALVHRMTDLGFDQGIASGIYKVLRDMESDGLITSSWDVSRHGGPPRRVYSLTAAGDRCLGDALPTLERQRYALSALLELARDLKRRGTIVEAVPPAADIAAGASAEPSGAVDPKTTTRPRPHKAQRRR